MPVTALVREWVVHGGLGSLPGNASEIPSDAKKSHFYHAKESFLVLMLETRLMFPLCGLPVFYHLSL